MTTLPHSNYLSGVYEGKRVLVTGHTGFKGTWLSSWLVALGAEVTGLSLDPTTSPSHYVESNLASDIDDVRLDIRERDRLVELVRAVSPDFVFHLAAQALVIQAYEDPVSTYTTNVIGSLNVLESLRALKKPCAVVMITSDKSYENREWVWGYRETDPIGGSDPYSASKAAVELVIQSHIKSYFCRADSPITLGVGRAGNVIGGGDWSPNRLIPDCVRAWSVGSAAELKNPGSTRPWQHVLEPLSGYLLLGARLRADRSFHGEVFNFGPRADQVRSVVQLVQGMSHHWDQVSWRVTSASDERPYEPTLLRLNCDKAQVVLQWQPILNFDDTVKLTSEWYKNFISGACPPRTMTLKQISNYLEAANDAAAVWAI